MDVVVAGNVLQFTALARRDRLLRGGVGRGLHVERLEGNHLFIVSEALVRAVNIERTIRHPCIALDIRILPHPSGWAPYPNNMVRPILFYEQQWLVNPLNLVWGTSAAQRVIQLKEAHPEYSEKYDWFLALFERIMEGPPMVPTIDEWRARGGRVIDDSPEGGEL